ncbi:MAG: sialidase family protein [Candidatus Latescibacteria bacterium]|nr:sialidase family protein [Candidatus Latescibacterota bacterium]
MTNDIVLQLDPTGNNPRNSEGSFLTLSDGRIMFAYTHFVGDDGGDNAPAHIAVRYSNDDGKSWDDSDQILVTNQGDMNVMSVSLLRLNDGRALLGYLIKHGWHDCRVRISITADDAESWSDPILAIAAPGYFVVNNDRMIQLSSGRLVVPASFHRMKAESRSEWSTMDSRGVLFFYLSDDCGETWTEAETWWALPEHSSAGIQEPGVIELKDERLFSWLRTSTGRQWASCSSDQGQTWSQPEPTEFHSPTSPMSVKRLPSGDLLAVWNDHSGRFPHPDNSEQRTPLVSAISSDDGATWGHHRALEDDPDAGYCYTAIHMLDDAVLLAYCAGSAEETGGILNRLRVRRIGVDWFYG